MSDFNASGLVDSGSSHCFIDPIYACDHNVLLISLFLGLLYIS